MGRGSKADARKVVLAALARGESISAAAKAAGVSRAAIYQWSNRGDEEVKAALARVGPPPPAKLLPDRGALAQALGVGLSTVRDWVASGLKPGDHGFDEAEVRRWLAARGLAPGRSGRPKKLHVLAGREAATREASVASGEPAAVGARPPGDDEGPPEAGDSASELLRKEALGKAQREWWRAKIDRLKALQQEGLLVDREEVTAEHAQMVARARARLLALPGALSAVLAAEVDARRVEALLDTQLRLALEELGSEVPA